MSINVEQLLQRKFSPVQHVYSQRDTMLYALSLGLGGDPTNTGQLQFVYEKTLRTFPTMPVIMGFPGFWAKHPDTGIDWQRLVHAEQSFELHKPLPPQGTVIGRNRVSAIYDKGESKGALLCQERQLSDTSGELIATVSQVTMLRGDGGCGSSPGAPKPPHVIPVRVPDTFHDLSTLPQMALLYRLNGDDNPLHVDPEVAKNAGFSRPILHGLCTMGIACHAALHALLDYHPERIRAMRIRFTAPVLPGDTLRTQLWKDDDVISLRTFAIERDVMVLDAGRIDLHSGFSSPLA